MLQDLIDKLLTPLLDFLARVVERVFDWIFQAVMWVPRTIWAEVLDVLAAIIEAIPVPSWASSAGSYWAAVPSDVWFFASPLRLGTGLGIIAAAYGIRFAVRRIPLIG